MKGKKTGGRTKGTPNRTTNELRDLIKDFVNQNISTLQSSFNELTPKDKLQFFEKMLSYAIPKLQNTPNTLNLPSGNPYEHWTDEMITKELARLDEEEKRPTHNLPKWMLENEDDENEDDDDLNERTASQ
jgi:hypothetical protein